MRAAAIIVLAAVLTLQVAESRSLQQALQATVHGDHVHLGQINQLKTRVDYDHTVNPLELRGTWLGDGDQYSQSVWEIFQNATALPDCSSDVDEFNYEHYAPNDPHFITLSGQASNFSRITAAHQLTTQTQVLNYTDNLMYIYTPSTGANTCSHFKPYVDLTTGLLKAEILNMNMYTQNATGYRVAQSMNCQVRGNEIPGCYTGQVARGPGLIGTTSYGMIGSPAAAPSVSAFSVPSGGVISVNRVTYTGMNGECLSLAPKFYEGDHTH